MERSLAAPHHLRLARQKTELLYPYLDLAANSMLPGSGKARLTNRRDSLIRLPGLGSLWWDRRGPQRADDQLAAPSPHPLAYNTQKIRRYEALRLLYCRGPEISRYLQMTARRLILYDRHHRHRIIRRDLPESFGPGNRFCSHWVSDSR